MSGSLLGFVLTRSDYPTPITDSEFVEIGHVTVVLQPIRLVTKLLEGEAMCTAALYLPLLHQLREAWKSEKYKVSSRLTPLFSTHIAKKDLKPLAKKLVVLFLRDKLQQKHMDAVHPMLLMCTFCDLRFLSHPCMDAKSRSAASQAVSEWAFQSHMKGAEIAANPDKRTWHVLAFEDKPAKGRGRAKATTKRKAGKIEPKLGAPALPKAKTVKKRILKQVDSSEDFLWGPARKPQHLVDENLEKDEQKIRTLIHTEMGRFEAMARAPSHVHPCDWWERHEVELPNLARVARMLQSIPGSSAAVERAFSAFARVADRKRPRLLQKNAARLLYAHENLKRGWTVDVKSRQSQCEAAE
eukprot:Skav236616  [mRNA]  locus=scaffold1476:211032:212096:- [translate_table: standard]